METRANKRIDDLKEELDEKFTRHSEELDERIVKHESRMKGESSSGTTNPGASHGNPQGQPPVKEEEAKP